MALNLNVKVKSSSILDAIRLLQARGRQKQLEKESNNKLEAKGKDAQAAKFASQGLDSKGQDQTGTKRQKLPAGEEPTSYRFGGGAGMSIAWVFTRQKEGLFYPQTSYTRFYTLKSFAYNVILSGSGAVKYEYETGYDHRDLWTQPGSGTTPPPKTEEPAPTVSSPRRIVLSMYPSILQGQPESRGIRFKIAIPVSEGVLLYYDYRKTETAYLFAAMQTWTYTTYPYEDTDLYDVQAPFVETDIVEECLLISSDSIKSIPVPDQFRERLLKYYPTYEITFPSVLLTPNSSFGTYDRVNGSNNNQTITSYLWTEIPAEKSLDDFTPEETERYSITDPLGPSTFPGSDFVDIRTGNYYAILVADQNTDYDKIKSKAPVVTNVNDSTGFGSGETWEEIYDNATTLKHACPSKAAKPNPINMSQQRITRPSDPLVYSNQFGNFTIPWTLKVFLCYDWANAKYCKEQLVKLGFTLSSLKPG